MDRYKVGDKVRYNDLIVKIEAILVNVGRKRTKVEYEVSIEGKTITVDNRYLGDII